MGIPGRWAALLACTSGVVAIVACTSDYGGSSATDAADAATDAIATPPPPPSDAGADATCEVPASDPSFLNDAVAIAAGGTFACALRANGSVACWGDERTSQLGRPAVDGGVNMSPTPIAIAGLPPASQLSVGFAHACIIASGTNEVWCWGDPDHDRLGQFVPGPAARGIVDDNANPFKAQAIAAGGDFTCALAPGGSVWCWGGNRYGQLANTYGIGDPNGTLSQPTLAPIPGSSAAITAGAYHACVMSSTNEIRCWGLNTAGQLGVPTAYDGGGSPAPVTFPTNGAQPAVVVAGLNQTCFLDPSRKPICSGYTSDGALGSTLSTQGQLTTPVAVPELAGGGIAELAVYAGHACARLDGGVAECMGQDIASLGRGPLDGGGFITVFPPEPVMGVTDAVLSPVAAITSGGSYGDGSFSCAIVKPACAASGPVVCWGSNAHGQIGDGTTTTRDRPVHVLAPK